jgi:hypothetical protein
MRGALRNEFNERVDLGAFFVPTLLHEGGPCPLDQAIELLGEHGYYGAERAEGVVYRVESEKHKARYVDYLAKWVRAGKEDGCYLPEMTGLEPAWNWRPM